MESIQRTERGCLMVTKTRPPAEEVARRARELYESRIRSQVEAGNVGKYLVIDVVSGEFEMDADHMMASDRAAAKHPDGWLYAMRIGHPVIGRIAARREAPI